ncbi:LysM peptidoglycan-binding domain-containing protein [Saccharopolyspora endophytica]|uniref:LysM peptidoglycan-binding domain-containing protein n=1 Tax=Saccharopolyspora endophytica TaxID=543886 RepID=A0ABS5D9W8_9PSEU|nr:LysM peptidoglycan-binding domain-containing protein [Saccharopolyspora endophytica]MBQ0923075.1 LysM peptidoglycan-binding domain-containing protein [Saccharopolyspora endophytica]
MTPAAEVRTRLLACAAITGLVALLTGLPVVLWALAEIAPFPTVRWPVPDFSPWAAPLPVQLGDWAGRLAETLRFELSPSRCALLGVLFTGWASWALLLAWTVADLARLLVPGRSRPVRRGTPRAWLTAVITWAVLSLFPGTMSAAPVATTPSVTALMPLPEGVAATPVYGDAPVGPGGYADPPPGPTTTAPNHPRYTVVRGDTLWDLAERYLGNPHRWGQLRDLNHDLLQGTDRLETGWVLRMPTDAALPTPAGIPATARWLTTKPGDTLATLAARELGSPDQWPVLFAVNAERPQPDGRVLRDPHHLFPGWHLALPAPPLPDPAPEAVSRGPAVAPARVSPAPQPVITDTGEIQLGARTFLGAATAAAVSAALVLARRRHRRHHRPGTHATADYPIAPAVYALHRAHPTSTTHAPDDEPRAPRLAPPPERRQDTDARELWLEIGVADGQTRHLNFSDARRVGVTGPGAHDVVRALLVNLALHPERPRLSLHTAAVAALFPDGPPPELGHWHQITDLHATPPGQLGDVLVAYTTVLDDDALPQTAGASVLALGPSPAGAQLAVEDSGVVSGASHKVSSLIGARLFTADEVAARDLLALGRAPQHDAVPPVQPVLQDHEPPPSSASPECAETPEDCAPLSLRVFGPVRLLWTSPEGEREDITEHFTPRLLELLAYLAVNPGVTRDTAIADLWQHAPSNRPTNALNTTLSRLRTALESATHGTVTDILDDTRQRRLSLDPAQVNTDYASFTEAERTSHDTSAEPRRLHAHHTVVEVYQGELAAGIDSEWIQAPRFAALRTAINAVSALARHHAPTDPERTLRMLETATGFDPANEHLYRDIMRLHARLGDTSAIPATLDLLVQRLRDIDTEPAPETLALATALQRPDSESSATKGEPARSGGLHPSAPKSH